VRGRPAFVWSIVSPKVKWPKSIYHDGRSSANRSLAWRRICPSWRYLTSTCQTKLVQRLNFDLRGG
jgi:hypothetical protein